MARDYIRSQLAELYLKDIKEILEKTKDHKRAVEKALEQISKFYQMSLLE